MNGKWKWTDDASCSVQNVQLNDENSVWLESTDYYHTEMTFTFSAALTLESGYNGMAGVLFRIQSIDDTDWYRYYYYGLNASSNSI